MVLEALASGRRGVASAVGGVPDLITRPELGTLVPARDVDALAAALVTALRTPYDPAVVAALGARGGWAASAAALHAVLASAIVGGSPMIAQAAATSPTPGTTPKPRTRTSCGHRRGAAADRAGARARCPLRVLLLAALLHRRCSSA